MQTTALERMFRIMAVLGLALAVLVASTPARAQDGEAEIEAVVADIVAAFNSGDAEAFAAYFTDEGLVAFVEAPEGTTRDEALEILGEFIGSATVEVIDVRDIELGAGTASAIVELSFEDGSVSIDRMTFIEVEGAWLVSNYETGVEQPPLPEIPAGYKTVPVDLLEYDFEFDVSQISVGDSIAFQAENIGEGPHELVLVKVPEDLDLEEALASEEPPPGIEDIAFTFVNPGQTGVAIAENPLAAGRYVMLCFVETEEGVPHVALGMIEEFTLEEPASQTPTPTTKTPRTEVPKPPKTGSGTAGDGLSSAAGFVAAGVLLAVLGFGGALATRRAVKR